MPHEIRLYTDEAVTMHAAVPVTYTVQTGTCTIHPQDEHTTLIAPGDHAETAMVLVQGEVDGQAITDLLTLYIGDRTYATLGLQQGEVVSKDQAHTFLERATPHTQAPTPAAAKRSHHGGSSHGTSRDTAE